jgi:hypothetical protein
MSSSELVITHNYKYQQTFQRTGWKLDSEDIFTISDYIKSIVEIPKLIIANAQGITIYFDTQCDTYQVAMMDKSLRWHVVISMEEKFGHIEKMYFEYVKDNEEAK